MCCESDALIFQNLLSHVDRESAGCLDAGFCACVRGACVCAIEYPVRWVRVQNFSEISHGITSAFFL